LADYGELQHEWGRRHVVRNNYLPAREVLERFLDCGDLLKNFSVFIAIHASLTICLHLNVPPGEGGVLQSSAKERIRYAIPQHSCNISFFTQQKKNLSLSIE